MNFAVGEVEFQITCQDRQAENFGKLYLDLLGMSLNLLFTVFVIYDSYFCRKVID